MKRFNICTAKPVTGQTKPIWRKVGELVEFEPDANNPNGQLRIELFANPTVIHYVFEQQSNGAAHSKPAEKKPATQSSDEDNDEETDTPC